MASSSDEAGGHDGAESSGFLGAGGSQGKRGASIKDSCDCKAMLRLGDNNWLFKISKDGPELLVALPVAEASGVWLRLSRNSADCPRGNWINRV
eukprot:CAMPEP_0202905810 /NCGR_PEP_ID=MMETSP1392-20130828/36137_1 /ASSEMBLY_ACC=CAM_ASM_000868 /TAXON_ID=225041 /ORGANISM="Chlamydomonas chlamydogama, Strain SAG 11-48b" /LENGTH=93 /DNA_ID=CAMNT_0049594083 /DNA_START=614 /DNA_END=895 /DNA_ORIENTATION=-